MKGKIKIVLLLAVLLLIAGGIYFFFSQKTSIQSTVSETPPAPKTVKLEILTPAAQIQASESAAWAEAVNGQDIFVGTKIKTDTDGQAKLIYPNGTETRLSENTEITLQEFNDGGATTVTLTAGKIWSRVAKLFGVESYQTQSENLVASVRGTSYGHEILPDGEDIIIVSESKVNGKCKNADLESDVSESYKGNFNCKRKTKPRVAKLLDREKKDKWYRKNNEDRPSPKATAGAATFKPTSSPTYSPMPTSQPSPTATAGTASPTPSPAPTQTATPSATPKTTR